MAKDLNKVMLTGRLGADPEGRYTPQGAAVTTFRVASNRAWTTSEGEKKEDTEWFSVVAWNKLAEICHQYLTKGSRVYIEGRAQTRSWVDDATGQTRYKTEVIASEMIILDGNNNGGGGGYSADPEDGPLGDYEDAPAAPPAPARRPAPAVAHPAHPASNPARPAPATPAGRTTAQRARNPIVQPNAPTGQRRDAAARQRAADKDDLPF